MPVDQTYKERILAVLLHIQRNLDDELSIEELARVAHFSPFHFHRIFRGLVGESVKEHIRRLRLERAAGQLKFSDQPIVGIALDAGYETHEAFTRAFGAMFGCSPREFRRAYQEKLLPAAPSGVHYCPGGELDDFEPLTPGGNAMDVRIEQLPALSVVFTRVVGPYKQVAHQAWQRLCSWTGPRGLHGPNTLCLGICHDDPDVTPPDRVRYDAAITVSQPVAPEGDIGVQEIPAGRYAVMTHRGPYEKLSQTWGQLCGQWLPGSGHRVRSAPSFEIYRNDPNSTPPEDLVTDVHLPIE